MSVRTEDFDCGIMISASHNPFNDNGIKVLNENGQKISADIEARIEAYLDGEIEELPLATGEDIGCTVDFASGRNRYIGHLISIPCHDFKISRLDWIAPTEAHPPLPRVFLTHFVQKPM